ncbi:uracil phosphoribosyltransferase [Cyphellophora europaea CBS 101466]|uniref:uracil phosphoribosyltransferase n=1 Tax=Cyphellophora europaea (strain CBS 101466) TaxID=1220924 RepID=W2S1C1_CYPE1|nr:uracil phosphoribosyltransferase [Cyphellophora europaea CBS 101466]ETN41853.1 uracil phosphoribosyltransferase [Cyphellophora europaea CBS 101466]
MSALPTNVHVSKHPCLRAKLSQLRSKSMNARETKDVVHEISLILATEALASLEVVTAGTDESPIGFQYDFETISPQKVTLVPILRSGLGMLDAAQAILPFPVPVHHLGLFREKISLQPVEYYNNLPQSQSAVAKLAIIVDPVVATGGTAVAAIQTLKEWGVERVIFIGILGAANGVAKVAEEWPEGVEVWMGGVDQSLTDAGMIKPGLGDVGDRLFLTHGK